MDDIRGASGDITSNLQRQRDVFDLVRLMKQSSLGSTIQLPQVIVCGDQSSGKSSVLGAISRLSFPTKDTVCTTFATELVMRRTDPDEVGGSSNSLDIRIVPSESRSDTEKLALQQWRSPIDDMEDFADIITAAGLEMQGGANTAVHFTDDILRVELKGPELHNLDLVDLPGIFHGAGLGQARGDVKKVKLLIERYMRNSRSVVLAVLSAKDDLAGQVVTSLVDEYGAIARTLAVVTKPDTLDEEPNKQQEYLGALSNTVPELKFGLGWHVLRNKKYTEQARTWEQRDLTEADFFRTGKWAAVPSGQKGVGSLVRRLQKIQEDWITSLAEALSQEVTAAIATSEQELRALQPPSMTELDLMTFGQRLHSLFLSATNGQYTNAFFKDLSRPHGPCKRLAHVLEEILARFAVDMHTRGHTWNILDDPVGLASSTSGLNSPTTVTRDDFVAKLAEKLRTSNAVPGQFVPAVFDEVFYEQAQEWPRLINAMVSDIVDATHGCLMAVVTYTCDKITDLERFFEIVVQPSLTAAKAALEVYIDQKMTAFSSRRSIALDAAIRTQVVPQAFRDEWSRVVRESVPLLVDVLQGAGSMPLSRLGETALEGLSSDISEIMLSKVSIDRFGGSVMLASLQRYYKTQLQKYIDYFDVESIHDHFFTRLQQSYSPDTVAQLIPQLGVLTVEDSSVTAQRDVVSSRLKGLQTVASELERLFGGKDPADPRKRALDSGTPTTARKKKRAGA